MTAATIVRMNEDLHKRFRDVISKHKGGYRKGMIQEAIEEAIELYIAKYEGVVEKNNE